MSKNKKDLVCFNSILERIRSLDCSIEDFKKKIECLQNEICEKNFEEEKEEVCLDELESELAMLEFVKEGYLEKISRTEPEGES